jgi:hypothetical protein
MHSRDLAAGRADLGETRRRFLFAREHLAAHAPGARPQRALMTGVHSQRADGGPAAGRASAQPAA